MSVTNFRDLEDRRVVAALRKAGVEVESIYDLVNSREPYPEAVPVLLQLLPDVRESVIKEGVVRALTVKEARGIAARPLIVEFKSIPPQREEIDGEQLLKWTLGNALSVVADDGVFGEIVDLLREKRHGQSRQMLALALGKMKDPRAVDVLLELLGDEDVAGHAIMALGRLKAKKARAKIESFLTHPKAWVRKEAKKAIAKINKASSRRRRPTLVH